MCMRLCKIYKKPKERKILIKNDCLNKELRYQFKFSFASLQDCHQERLVGLWPLDSQLECKTLPFNLIPHVCL